MHGFTQTCAYLQSSCSSSPILQLLQPSFPCAELLGEEEAPPPAQHPSSQTPQTSGERSDGALGGAPRGRKRGPKRLKPTVDDIETLQIRGKVRCSG